jgi:bacillithiol system protein YtxJ
MLRPLDSLDALGTALAKSAIRPAVIFKHSVTCGTSAMAMVEIRDLLDGPAFDADFYLVPVQQARAVSRAAEAQLGIRHESPQVLVVVDGRVVWHASHFRVTAAAVLAAVRHHATATVVN